MLLRITIIFAAFFLVQCGDAVFGGKDKRDSTQTKITEETTGESDQEKGDEKKTSSADLSDCEHGTIDGKKVVLCEEGKGGDKKSHSDISSSIKVGVDVEATKDGGTGKGSGKIGVSIEKKYSHCYEGEGEDLKEVDCKSLDLDIFVEVSAEVSAEKK